MNSNTIAAQLYTLRDFCRTPEDIRNTLTKVKKMGYNSVQVSGIGPIDPVLLKDICDELGLTICITHVPYDRLLNDTVNVINEHILWGCEAAGLGSMPAQFRTSRDGIMEFAGIFNKIALKFAEKGLKLDYHNHKFEFEKYDGTTGMEILVNATDPDAVGFILDTYWVQAGGANPVEWIRKVRGRMRVIHLKDMAIKGDQQVYAEIGQGNLDWPSIIKACRETGVKWYAVEQDTCQRDPFDCLATSLDFLKGLI